MMTTPSTQINFMLSVQMGELLETGTNTQCQNFRDGILLQPNVTATATTRADWSLYDVVETYQFPTTAPR